MKIDIFVSRVLGKSLQCLYASLPSSQVSNSGPMYDGKYNAMLITTYILSLLRAENFPFPDLRDLRVGSFLRGVRGSVVMSLMLGQSGRYTYDCLEASMPLPSAEPSVIPCFDITKEVKVVNSEDRSHRLRCWNSASMASLPQPPDGKHLIQISLFRFFANMPVMLARCEGVEVFLHKVAYI